MPNHIHLIGEPRETGNLAKFMQSLNRSYTAYFNKRYKKVGHLWQGRFKSKVIIKDGYLLDCIHYIELNPLRANIVKAAGDYLWSSHKERVFSQGRSIELLDTLQI
jgi:putative transposase